MDRDMLSVSCYAAIMLEESLTCIVEATANTACVIVSAQSGLTLDCGKVVSSTCSYCMP